MGFIQVKRYFHCMWRINFIDIIKNEINQQWNLHKLYNICNDVYLYALTGQSLHRWFGPNQVQWSSRRSSLTATVHLEYPYDQVFQRTYIAIAVLATQRDVSSSLRVILSASSLHHSVGLDSRQNAQ